MSDSDLEGVLLPAEPILPIPAPSAGNTSVEPTRSRTRKLTEEVKQKVKELLSQKIHPEDISKQVGISKSSIFKISKEKNLSEEEMDNGSFLSAINGTKSSLLPPAIQQPDKAELSKVINEFMPLVEERKPSKKAPKIAKESLLAEFMEEDKPLELSVVKTFKPEDKSIYIAKITMNVDTFPEVLKDHIKPDRDAFIGKVNKMPLSDLQHTLGMLETTRSSNNFANQLKYLLYGGANLIEFGTQKFLNMQTQGYSMMLRQQEAEIQSCLREIAINNIETYKKVEKPEIRLASVLVTTLLATDARNRMQSLQEQYKAQQVKPKDEKEFEGL